MFLSVSTHIFLAGLLSTALAFSPSFLYGTEKVRGVSLGGWLVLEVRIHNHFFLYPQTLTHLHRT
jgi:hypothetical protein